MCLIEHIFGSWSQIALSDTWSEIHEEYFLEFKLVKCSSKVILCHKC